MKNIWLQGWLLSLLVSGCIFSADYAWAQRETPQQLVKDTVWNELQDRKDQTWWQYRVSKRVGQSPAEIREQVETSNGPIYRLLGYGSQPLNDQQRRQEESRLDDLLHSASRQEQIREQYRKDEEHLGNLIQQMPQAFLYSFDRVEGDSIRLNFRPNPDYNPPSAEGRVFHALSGTIWINQQHKRLERLQGALTSRLDFGYGILGHIEKGGTFEVRRCPVNATHWKTELIDIHMSGKMMFFKNLSKDQHEVRSHFRLVPSGLSFAQARALLDETSFPEHAEALRR